MRPALPQLLLAAAITAIPALATAADWGKNPKIVESGCFASVEGEVLVDYECSILLYKGGDFEVSQLNGNVFVGVEVTGDGVGKAHYRETEGDHRMVEDLGSVRREKFDPACWAGEMARVCAR